MSKYNNFNISQSIETGQWLILWAPSYIIGYKLLHVNISSQFYIVNSAAFIFWKVGHNLCCLYQYHKTWQDDQNCVEIWAVSKLLLRKYLAPGYLLSRNRRRKRGYSSHPIQLIIIWKARPLRSVEFIIAYSVKTEHNQAQQQVCVDEGLRLTKQEIQGNLEYWHWRFASILCT